MSRRLDARFLGWRLLRRRLGSRRLDAGPGWTGLRHTRPLGTWLGFSGWTGMLCTRLRWARLRSAELGGTMARLWQTGLSSANRRSSGLLL